MCLIRDVWNASRKSAHMNCPLSLWIANRTLAIRCSWWMNHHEQKVFRMSKTEYLSMASEIGFGTGSAGRAGVSSD
jgi:hypothetical protein